MNKYYQSVYHLLLATTYYRLTSAYYLLPTTYSHQYNETIDNTTNTTITSTT